MYNPNQPGFVVPPQQQQPVQPAGYPMQPPYNPSYPPPQPAGYPPTLQASYPPQPPYQHQPFPGPIQQQPAMGGQNAYPDFQDHLKHATSFHVKQHVELLEALVGFETENKYTVKDQAGNKIFYVTEQSSCLARQCCLKSRPFNLTVKDSLGVDVMRFERELDCSCFCGLLLPDSVQATRPNGQPIGIVLEEFSLLYPKFSIKDAAGNVRLKIKGPVCPLSLGCGSDAVFKVRSADGVTWGTISKHWSGLMRELFTDADYFSVSFPMELDPSLKATCLAALFLIDFEYFENGSNGQGGRRLFG